MWTLVIVFAFNTGLATAVLPGFKSSAACVKEGNEIISTQESSALEFACIQVK